MEQLLEQIVSADHPTKMELVDEVNALPPQDVAAAVAALPSVEDQESVVGAIIDKWIEDGGMDGRPAWEGATPTLLALRAALLEQWEAENRAELASMQVFRLSYVYKVGVLASLVKDAAFEQVRGVITEQLLEGDVADDAKAILKMHFGVSGD